MNAEQVAQTMSTMGTRDPGEARSMIRGRREDILKKAKDIADGAGNADLAVQEMEKYTAMFVTMGKDVDTAVSLAEEATRERLTEVDGALVPAGSFVSDADDFASIQENYVREHLRPALNAEKPGGYDDVRINMLPVPGKPGWFAPLDEFYRPVMLGGKFELVNEADMAKKATVAKNKRTHAIAVSAQGTPVHDPLARPGRE
jgi:hypothetical protein